MIKIGSEGNCTKNLFSSAVVVWYKEKTVRLYRDLLWRNHSSLRRSGSQGFSLSSLLFLCTVQYAKGENLTAPYTYYQREKAKKSPCNILRDFSAVPSLACLCFV